MATRLLDWYVTDSVQGLLQSGKAMADIGDVLRVAAYEQVAGQTPILVLLAVHYCWAKAGSHWCIPDEEEGEQIRALMGESGVRYYVCQYASHTGEHMPSSNSEPVLITSDS